MGIKQLKVQLFGVAERPGPCTLREFEAVASFTPKMFSMTSAMQEFSATWSNPSFTSRSSPMLPPNLRGLQHAVAAHKVDIYVSLEYLREEVSSSFESRQPEDPVVSHFCKAVNYQVCLLYVFV